MLHFGSKIQIFAIHKVKRINETFLMIFKHYEARVKNAPSATPLIIPKISQASAVVAADDDVDKTGLKLRRFLFVALLTVVTLSVRQVRHEETISICDFVLDDNSCLLRLRVVS